LELRHLRYFVAVAEELHFGHAAARLHISQPPLSHQIQDLERELGVTLFHRSRRSVALTEAGRLFLEEARQVLGDAKHAIEIAKKAARGEIGRLSVGFGPTPENGLLNAVLSLFLARHPDVQLELHSLYTQEQVEALAHRQIDVCFPLLPIANRNICVERIAVEPIRVALPSHHPMASQSRIALGDLRQEPFVLVSREVGPGFYDLLLNACAAAGFTPRITHEARHVMTVLGFVAAGLGVTLMPGAVSNACPPGVVFRPLHRAPVVELGLGYRPNDSSPPLLAFLEVVREVARQKRRRLAWASASA
jgi:DNA-binding transcriptional LysR family regulator